MASAVSWFEVEPLQQLLERDRRRGDGVAKRLSTTLSSLTIARAPSAKPVRRALRLGKRVDSALLQIEKTVAKGIRLGGKIDSGLSKVAELADSVGEALGEGSALGRLARQIGAGLGKGDEKLQDALRVARDGEELLAEGHHLLHRALVAAEGREPVGELIDALAPDTWIGSGEGTQDFSDVFGPFLPAEGARVRGERRQRSGLEGFVERVGGWAEEGERAAEKVHRFAGSAEKFLHDLGLHDLAGVAAKAAAAAGWAEDKAEVVRGAAQTADRWMGETKKVLGPLLDARRRAPDAPRAPPMETLDLRRPVPDFRLAEDEGGAAGIATPRRTGSRGDEVAGKDAPPDGEEFLEEVSGRVYDLLMDDLEQAFESR